MSVAASCVLKLSFWNTMRQTPVDSSFETISRDIVHHQASVRVAVARMYKSFIAMVKAPKHENKKNVIHRRQPKDRPTSRSQGSRNQAKSSIWVHEDRIEDRLGITDAGNNRTGGD